MRQAALEVPLGDERHNADPQPMNFAPALPICLVWKVRFSCHRVPCAMNIALHARPDEVICTRESHIIFASGGPAALSGVMMCPLDTERGMLTRRKSQNLCAQPLQCAAQSRIGCRANCQSCWRGRLAGSANKCPCQNSQSRRVGDAFGRRPSLKCTCGHRHSCR